MRAYYAVLFHFRRKSQTRRNVETLGRSSNGLILRAGIRSLDRQRRCNLGITRRFSATFSGVTISARVKFLIERAVGGGKEIAFSYRAVTSRTE